MAKQSRHVAAQLLAYIALIALSFWSAGAQTQSSTQTGEWTMAGKDYDNTRFSEPGEISASNVRNLRLAFSFSTGSTRGHEAAPLIVGSTMYIVTPYPNVVYALDLTKPGSPPKWKYEPKPASSSQGRLLRRGESRPRVFERTTLSQYARQSDDRDRRAVGQGVVAGSATSTAARR